MKKNKGIEIDFPHLKIDLHVHTNFSDGMLSPKEVIKVAKKIGLNGIAICDHNAIDGHRTLKLSKKERKDFVVLPGVEVSTDCGHILALGIQEEIKRSMTPVETVEAIRDQGALVIIPHPGKVPSGLNYRKLRGLDFDAVEVINGRSPTFINSKSYKYAQKNKKAMVGGSDGHTIDHFGSAYTIFQIDSLEPDDLYQQILKRKTLAGGASVRYSMLMADLGRIFTRYAKRGFRRI